LAIWIAWNPLIDIRQDANASPKSVRIIDFVGRLLFGIYLCAGLLLFEKFCIQWIAAKFHERSYAGRGPSPAVYVHLTLFFQSASQSKNMPSKSSLLYTAIQLTYMVMATHMDRRLRNNP